MLSAPTLLADVGATHTRFTLHARGAEAAPSHTFDNNVFDGFEAVLAEGLASCGAARRPLNAVFAVAGPVHGDSVTMTHLGWRLSAPDLRRRFDFRDVQLMNDFCAVALALPALDRAARVPIGAGGPGTPGTVGVLGPGSGLGVAGLVRTPGGWTPIPGEGGHVTLPARGALERAVVQRLEQRFGHVSAERALSGPGLENLYRALAEERGAACAPPAAPEISARAVAHGDPIAVAALEMFFLMLGTVAGDLALTLGAAGGVYLAGGILPKLRAPLAASGFRERFVDKGDHRGFLETVPTFLVTAADPALIGLRRYVDQGA